MQSTTVLPITVLHVKTPFRDGGVETLMQRMLEIHDKDRVRQQLVMLDRSRQNAPPPYAKDAQQVAWRGVPFSPRTASDLGRVFRESHADLIHTHDMRSNLVAFQLTRFQRIPWLASVHGWLGPTHTGRWRLYEKLEGQIVRSADYVMVGSTASQREVEACGAKRVRTIHHGIPMPEPDAWSEPALQVRRSIAASPETTVIGVVARVHPGKGLRNLILALEALIAKKHDVRGLIVGDGMERQGLQDYLTSRGLNRWIRLTGYVDDQNPFLAAMDIVALPTLKDSLPFSILDGMAFGKPVVTTTVGDLPLAVDDGKNGFLVAPGEVPPLIVALEKLVINSKLRLDLGTQGREDIRQRFSTVAMSNNLESLYREVLERNSALLVPVTKRGKVPDCSLP